MVWPFSNNKEKQKRRSMVFTTGVDFFKYQCKYGQTSIAPNQGIVALVLDASVEFGTPVAVKVESDGRQMAVLKVASEDGGFVVCAYTPTGKGERLKPGDVVVWLPVSYCEDIVHNNKDVDLRLGWVGLIVAKVALEIRAGQRNLDLLCRYD